MAGKGKKIVVDKAADNLKDFQSQYANDWAKIIDSPAFRYGMQLLNVLKLDKISFLTNEEIEKHGVEILSDLRGHLQHENDLLTLHSKREFTLPYEEPEEYFSPEQVAELEQLKSKLRQETSKSRYA